MTSLSEQIRGYLLGGQPIKRQDRKAGQTQYYYINPGQEYATASDLQTTDIPDEMMNHDGTMKNAGQLNNVQKYNQEVLNSVVAQNNTTQQSDYQLKPANTYAWDVPNKYDHRDNLMATWHNFEIINKEHPVEKPVSTGNAVLDNYILKRIAVTSPLAAASISAFNYGYQGAGYYDNWQQAKEVKETPEMKYFPETYKTYLKNR